MGRLRRPSPALVLSLVALFFALGGSAYALGSKITPQPRCAQGAVRGIAVVGGTNVDFSSFPTAFDSHPEAFHYRWSCTGGQILIAKPLDLQNGVAIKFVGNPATVAIVSSAANGTPYGGSVSRSADGSFHVVMGGANSTPGPWQAQWNVPFTIVLL
jgi:hypothetical protein